MPGRTTCGSLHHNSVSLGSAPGANAPAPAVFPILRWCVQHQALVYLSGRSFPTLQWSTPIATVRYPPPGIASQYSLRSLLERPQSATTPPNLPAPHVSEVPCSRMVPNPERCAIPRPSPSWLPSRAGPATCSASVWDILSAHKTATYLRPTRVLGSVEEG